jgi:hypothetical protein
MGKPGADCALASATKAPRLSFVLPNMLYNFYMKLTARTSCVACSEQSSTCLYRILGDQPLSQS